MKESSAIICKKCGVKHYMAKDGKGHAMPVFCCGSELKTAESSVTSSNALKKTQGKKK